MDPLWRLRHVLTISHTVSLKDIFETGLPKRALVSMADFSQMRLDVAAWTAIYIDVVQRIANAMPIDGSGASRPRCTSVLAES
ncbi:hypothetical protein [Haloechinothrix alba]|uniref:hypothetical protein n=1 Tax=Haloechinothrix alba TaxID=664784 RepID=UPI001131A487|nr:hypothetical protein [Haloechinothrix alba]